MRQGLFELQLNCKFNVALRPQRAYGLRGTGRPPPLSHTSWARTAGLATIRFYLLSVQTDGSAVTAVGPRDWNQRPATNPGHKGRQHYIFTAPPGGGAALRQQHFRAGIVPGSTSAADGNDWHLITSKISDGSTAASLPLWPACAGFTGFAGHCQGSQRWLHVLFPLCVPGMRMRSRARANTSGCD